jgi:hypothetical protein
MIYGLIFWGIPFSECKKELLQSLWDLEAETLVENNSRN